jgi:hypothetical protein
MRALALVLACSAALACVACDDTKRPPAAQTTESGSQPARTRPASSPTPSTPAEHAAAIRAALTRRGTATVTLSSYENTYKTTTSYNVDCRSARPRAKFKVVKLPGGQGLPPRRVQILADGQSLYSETLNSSASRPWYRGKITELESNEFRTASGSPVATPFDLYLANCDQPSMLAWFGKSLDHLTEPIAIPAKSETRS